MKKIFHPLFTFNYFYRGDNLPSNFRFIITKKIAPKAVTRNRIKRLFRESIRSSMPQAISGYDMAFIIKDKALDIKFEILKEEIKSVLEQYGITKKA